MTYRKKHTSTLLLALMFALPGMLTLADETDPIPVDNDTGAQDDSQDDKIEEIVVYGRKRGSQADDEPTLEEKLREQMLEDLGRTEELRDASASGVESPSRVRVGYDPAHDAETQRDTSMTDLPIDKVKPATVIKIEF